MSDFKAKMHKIRFLLGQNRAPPQFPPRELTALPDLLGLAVFKRTTSEGREKEQGRRRKGRERGRKGTKGAGSPQYFGLEPPLLSFVPGRSSHTFRPKAHRMRMINLWKVLWQKWSGHFHLSPSCG